MRLTPNLNANEFTLIVLPFRTSHLMRNIMLTVFVLFTSIILIIIREYEKQFSSIFSLIHTLPFLARLSQFATTTMLSSTQNKLLRLVTILLFVLFYSAKKLIIRNVVIIPVAHIWLELGHRYYHHGGGDRQ